MHKTHKTALCTGQHTVRAASKAFGFFFFRYEAEPTHEESSVLESHGESVGGCDVLEIDGPSLASSLSRHPWDIAEIAGCSMVRGQKVGLVGSRRSWELTLQWFSNTPTSTVLFFKHLATTCEEAFEPGCSFSSLMVLKTFGTRGGQFFFL